MTDRPATAIFTIQPIAIDHALPLRQEVLWPNHPIAASQVKGDDTALHFGGFLANSLICTASLFAFEDSIRLRKFATRPQYQGNGYGGQMLIHLIEYAKAAEARLFWLDARQNALRFYQRHGFHPVGAPFRKRTETYLRMELSL